MVHAMRPRTPLVFVIQDDTQIGLGGGVIELGLIHRMLMQVGAYLPTYLLTYLLTYLSTYCVRRTRSSSTCASLCTRIVRTPRAA